MRGNFGQLNNGALDGWSTTAVGALDSSAINGIKIGGHTGSNEFGGRLDEVKVFNYALSPEQIREEYNGGFGTYFK